MERQRQPLEYHLAAIGTGQIVGFERLAGWELELDFGRYLPGAALEDDDQPAWGLFFKVKYAF